MSLPTPQIGDAIVDGQLCFPDLNNLSTSFDVHSFLALCHLIDAAVIHQRLLVPFLPEPQGADSIATKLLQQGVLLRFDDDFLRWLRSGKVTARAKEVGRRFIPSESLKAVQYIYNRNPWTDPLRSVLPAAAFLGGPHQRPSPQELSVGSVSMAALEWLFPYVMLEDHLQVSFLPTSRILPLYLQIPNIENEEQAYRRLEGALADTYADIRKLLGILYQTVNRGAITLPPIALQVLDRAKSLEDIGDEIEAARHRYRKVRDYFTKLDAILQSPDVTIKKKLKAKAKLSRAINKLFKGGDLDQVTVFMSLAGGLNESVSIPGLLKGPGWEDFDLIKLAVWLVEVATSLHWRFRMRPLYGTKKRYLKLTDTRIQKIIARHFNHELTKSDLEEVRAYEFNIRKVTERLLP